MSSSSSLCKTSNDVSIKQTSACGALGKIGTVLHVVFGILNFFYYRRETYASQITLSVLNNFIRKLRLMFSLHKYKTHCIERYSSNWILLEMTMTLVFSEFQKHFLIEDTVLYRF